MKVSKYAALLVLAICSGCASFGQARIPTAAPNRSPAFALGSRIKHVIIIVQENRTFDNIFDGFPGARSSTTGLTSSGKRIALRPIGFQQSDINHDWRASITSWDRGKMDGFDKNALDTGAPAGTFPYAYLARSFVTPYWTMARQYTLADRFFPTMFGGSFTAHLDLIAGTADLSPTVSEVDYPTGQPWGCDAPGGTMTFTLSGRKAAVAGSGPFPCFTQFRTMADTLDAAGVTWKYYAPAVTSGDIGGSLWTEFDAIKNVRYGADWNANFPPPTAVLADAKAGSLPNVAWVIPDFLDSDHAASDTGPSWVAAVVNAIGQGPQWKSTAIVVVWDDWGGWYDDAAPPQKDFRGLGIRVPAILISPYSKRGVSHTQYEFGSILKFIERAFDLPTLGPAAAGYTDGRATSLIDSFDFAQTPITFVKIPAKYPSSYFLQRHPSLLPPDDD
ncbi:MAG TPA: alkaline phosphatase family protein [Candidatus Acidoferrales bacterium]|nr:alkaline phosphatase family protein [Candidatus Acidoferrales bacterium]